MNIEFKLLYKYKKKKCYPKNIVFIILMLYDTHYVEKLQHVKKYQSNFLFANHLLKFIMLSLPSASGTHNNTYIIF